MAEKKTAAKKVLERTYNVPLRKESQKSPRWKRTKKAISALKEFLSQHLRSDNVKLSPRLNEEMWKHGIKNPPHHIKVNVTKDDSGLVQADLFGAEEKVIRAKKDKSNSKKEKK